MVLTETDGWHLSSIKMAMAGYTVSEHGSDPFQEALLRHRKGEYDSEIDGICKIIIFIILFICSRTFLAC